MNDTVVVVNPAARGGRAGRLWEELRAAVPRVADAAVVRAESPDAARQALVRRLDAGARRLVVLGGDGTVHFSGNLLMQLGLGHRVALGLLPTGTGSDLAAGLGVPSDPRAALERLLSAEPRAMDVIELDTGEGRRRFVLNVASAGLSAAVAAAVAAVPNRGAVAYLRRTLSALRRYRPTRCRVRVDGEDWHEGEFLVVAVANGSRFGRGMRIAPSARVDDGQADVVLIEPASLLQLHLRLPQLYLGRHLNSRLVRWCRASTVSIEGVPSLPPLETDGEPLTAAVARFTVLPGALRVLA